jgi:peroxiredoxin
MAFAESNMLPIGTKAPNFLLPDTISNSTLSFQDVKGPNGTLVIFSCNHCPYVIHINAHIVSLAHEYLPKGIKTVLISPNDAINYPEDTPDKMSIVAKVLQYPFPYLYDETQETARAYDAACTPDIYLFDAEDRLYYRGRLDDSRPKNNIPVTGKDLKSAMNDMLLGKASPEKQYPSGGCNIKWKK